MHRMRLLTAILLLVILIDHSNGSTDKELVQSCSFDFGSFSNFTQATSNDKFDWSTGTKTPSTNTGPSYGMGLSGYFAYIEASSPRKLNDHADLLSPTLGPGVYQIEFYHFARGSAMGSLKVSIVNTIISGTGDYDVWSRSIFGNANDINWNKETINVTSADNFNVAFIGTVGSSYNSDFAIDEIKIYRFNSLSYNVSQSIMPSKNVLSCDFGTVSCNLCSLTNLRQDTFDWKSEDGSSGTPGTGPSSPYSGFGCYALADATYTTSNDFAELMTPLLHSNTGCMTFTMIYYGYGQWIGSLEVILHERTGTITPMWTTNKISKEQWIAVRQDFNVTAQFVLIIRSVIGNHPYSDYAIDDFMVGECGTVPYLQSSSSAISISPVQTVSCDFNSRSFCQLVHSSESDFDWSLHRQSTPSYDTGPNCDVTCTGYYAYIETSSPQTINEIAILETQPLQSSSGCIEVEFYYNGYGSQLGYLTVQYKESGTWALSTTAWTASRTSSKAWRYERLTISHQNTVQVAFKGTVGSGYRGDYAIDNVVIGQCGSLTQAVTTVSGSSSANYFTSETGSISSPGYPTVKYPNNANIKWYISVSTNRYLTLVLSDLDVESCCDELKIYDTRFATPTLVKRWTGQYYYQSASSVSTYSNQIEIVFTSDVAVKKKGFSLSWYSTDDSGATNAPVTVKMGPSPTRRSNSYFNTGGFVGGGIGIGVMIFIITISCIRYKKRARTNPAGARSANGQQNAGFIGQQYQSASQTTNPNNNSRYYNPAYSQQTPWYQLHNERPANNQSRQPTENNNKSTPSAQTNATTNDENRQPVPGPVTGPIYTLPRDHLAPLSAPPSYAQLYGTGSYDVTSSSATNYVP